MILCAVQLASWWCGFKFKVNFEANALSSLLRQNRYSNRLPFPFNPNLSPKMLPSDSWWCFGTSRLHHQHAPVGVVSPTALSSFWCWKLLSPPPRRGVWLVFYPSTCWSLARHLDWKWFCFSSSSFWASTSRILGDLSGGRGFCVARSCLVLFYGHRRRRRPKRCFCVRRYLLKPFRVGSSMPVRSDLVSGFSSFADPFCPSLTLLASFVVEQGVWACDTRLFQEFLTWWRIRIVWPEMALLTCCSWSQWVVGCEFVIVLVIGFTTISKISSFAWIRCLCSCTFVHHYIFAIWFQVRTRTRWIVLVLRVCTLVVFWFMFRLVCNIFGGRIYVFYFVLFFGSGFDVVNPQVHDLPM